MACCRNCGTQIDATHTPVQGRGYAITSLVIGILSLSVSFLCFLFMINAITNGARIAMLLVTIVYSPLSIMAIIFGVIAKRKGYVNGLSKTGLTLGIIGAVLFAITIAFMLVFL